MREDIAGKGFSFSFISHPGLLNRYGTDACKKRTFQEKSIADNHTSAFFISYLCEERNVFITSFSIATCSNFHVPSLMMVLKDISFLLPYTRFDYSSIQGLME